MVTRPIEGAGHGGLALLQADFSTKMARLGVASNGQNDPDAFLRVGEASLEEALAGARPLTEFLIDDVLRRHASGLGQG